MTAVPPAGRRPGRRVRARAAGGRRQRRRRRCTRWPASSLARARAGDGPTPDRGGDLPARRPLAGRPGASTGPPRRSQPWLPRDPVTDVPRPGCSARVWTSRGSEIEDAVDAARSTRPPRRPRRAPAPGADLLMTGRVGGRRLGMAQLTYREAVARGIAQEMRPRRAAWCSSARTSRAPGGVFKATVGLLDEFGPVRVRDTPISEQAILGAAMGAAMTGHAADRRDHVQRLPRRLLGHRRQRDRQDPLHDRRADVAAAGDPLRPTAAGCASAPSTRRASRTGRWPSPGSRSSCRPRRPTWSA